MSLPPPTSRELAEKVIPAVRDSMNWEQGAQDFLLLSLFHGGPNGREMPPEIIEEDLADPQALLCKLESIAYGD